ncbi:MAG: M50 family metallopeptidase [Christensenellales bacterium]
MAKLKIKFHPLFVIFIVFLLFSNNFLQIFAYILCVFLHELGHSFMAGTLGYKLNQITFLPFGASLSGTENVFYKPSHEILIAVAGPLVNLVLLIVCLALFWVFPTTYFFLEEFYYANLTTFLFNLFPVFPLDGGRVLFATIKTKKPIKQSYKAVKIVGIIFASLLFVLFIVSSFFKINFTLGITSLFLIGGIFFEDNSSFYVTNFCLTNKSKKLNLGIETSILSVSENTSLYNILRKLNKFKYNMVNVVSKSGKVQKCLTEQELNNIFENFPLQSLIGSIIKQT